ncbi:MAG TPA: 5-(carboxyamino)imidazole ribonucleotide synthase [Pyrinomonadaceae bacterium]|jgi:5-(carboxyamino)imidazole ribonucleotide synthase|nr:5-(carboxyamino)imidazole ribonucleotide synthase [Pyrinomonadaceae bacterium]
MSAILPGATVGVLGSGQLGRMFAIAARRMGYRVHTFSPDSDTPTGQISDREYQRPYEDLDAVAEFARGVSVLTFEFENVPAEAVEAASQRVPVRPSGEVLYTTQNRLREKNFLSRWGFPVTRFRHITSEESLRAALAEIGYPAILKTASSGYDGKGQMRLDSAEDVEQRAASLGEREWILEAFVDFEREVSVVAARTAAGEFRHYGVIENAHRRHILDLSVAPARVAESVVREAVEITRAVLEALDVVGVMCVEFFHARDGRLLINELAPRPHNSGHLTVDACLTSQFEQQLRAVCGLPLGSTEMTRPAAMANLLGDLWHEGEPDWRAVLTFPAVKLHLYGKSEARPGRKMGHLTALAASAEEAARTVLAARDALMRSRASGRGNL